MKYKKKWVSRILLYFIISIKSIKSGYFHLGNNHNRGVAVSESLTAM